MTHVDRAPRIGEPGYKSRFGGIDPTFRGLVSYTHTEPEVISGIKRRPWIGLLLCALSAALVVGGVWWLL